MRKIAGVISVCLLAMILALGQSSSQSQPQGSQQGQSQQQPQAQPSQQGGSAGSGTPAQPNQQPMPEQATKRPQQQRASNLGVPWIWVVIGVVIVVFLIALAVRGAARTDTVQRVERTDEHRDETRRAG